MAADAWVFHDEYKEFLGDGTVNMATDNFEMRLYDSGSNVNDTTIGNATTVTDELSGNGYTPYSMSTTWTRSGGTVTFDSDDASYTASGGSISTRFAAVVDTSTTPDLVVCHSLLDNAPSNVTVTDGNILTIQINAAGINTLT